MAIRIKENQSSFTRIRHEEIANYVCEHKPGYFEIYRDLTEDEKVKYPGMIVITENIKTAPKLNFKDFELIRSILAKKYKNKVSQYPKIKCITNYIDPGSLMIYIQIIINNLSLSLIFNPIPRFESFDQYNSIDDKVEGNIYIENDMEMEIYDAPEYYEEVCKHIIIHDHIKWIEESFKKFNEE
tara:strand:- start:23 stop:574 length:552 start_codon:yes stop_codon:yes gene_type:complete